MRLDFAIGSSIAVAVVAAAIAALVFFVTPERMRGPVLVAVIAIGFVGQLMVLAALVLLRWS